MTTAERERLLVEHRARRTEAWRAVQGNVQQLQSDLDARGILDRVKDRVADESAELWGEAKAAAAENRPLVVGTIAALVAWILREPIVALLTALATRVSGSGDADEDALEDDDEQGDPT